MPIKENGEKRTEPQSVNISDFGEMRTLTGSSSIRTHTGSARATERMVLNETDPNSCNQTEMS